MEHLKRIFQCVNPGLRSSPDNSGNSPAQRASGEDGVSEIDTPQSGAPERSDRRAPWVSKNLFQPQPPKADALRAYKQQHRASLAESQAVFEMQKQYLEKRIHYINTQIEKFEQKCVKIQEKLEILKGDVPGGDWVKFG